LGIGISPQGGRVYNTTADQLESVGGETRRVPETYPTRLRIVQYPEPMLRQRTQPIEVFDEALADLARRMIALMHEAKGVGLAAPQVGLSLRLFVCNATGEPQDNQVVVNPILLDFEGFEEKPEGCLSIPGVTVNMRRPARVRLTALNAQGEAYELKGDDLRARIWQHETDHLDGKLIIDNMSEADEIANRKALKQLRGGK